MFQSSRSHLCLISPDVPPPQTRSYVLLDPAHRLRILGMATLEDIVESMIQEEIEDESDALRVGHPSILVHAQSLHETPPPSPRTPLVPQRDGADYHALDSE